MDLGDRIQVTGYVGRGILHATRITKLLQMSVRKKVFEQAIRLPMHRVQELKSGGAASVLRQDAGAVGELVW